MRHVKDGTEFAHRMERGRFLPLVSIASLQNAAEKEKANQIVQRITSDTIPHFDELLWTEFDRVAKVLQRSKVDLSEALVGLKCP